MDMNVSYNNIDDNSDVFYDTDNVIVNDTESIHSFVHQMRWEPLASMDPVDGVRTSFIDKLKTVIDGFISKFKHCTSEATRYIVKVVQTLVSSIKNIVNVFHPVTIIRGATSLAYDATVSASTSLFTMFMDILDYFPSHLMDTVTFVSSLVDVALCLIEAPMLLVSGRNPVKFYGLNFYRRFAIFVLEFYKLLKRLYYYTEPEPLPRAHDSPLRAEPQSNLDGVEAVLTMLIAKMALPKVVFETLRDFQCMMNFKILEDTMWLPNMINMLIEFPYRLSKNMGLPEKVTSLLQMVALYSPFGKVSRVKHDILSVYDEAVKNRWNFTPALCANIDEIMPKYEEVLKEMMEVRREVPPHFVDANNKMKKLKTKYMYKKNSTRVEPVCVVFVGPPGTGKSTLLARMVESYTDSIYKHASPGSDKEFYDQYDNEDIFVMDDVGQKGVSQWADIINMVSTIAYPLNCAAADLKGTKYFTSKLMLMTTNNINLTLTPDCGISDLQALHRRLCLVDFTKCKFQYGAYYGQVELKRYNLNNKVFEVVKTLDLTLSPNGVDIPMDTLCLAIDTWIYDILKTRKIQYSLRGSTKLTLKGIPQMFEMNDETNRQRFERTAKTLFQISMGTFVGQFAIEFAYLMGLITERQQQEAGHNMFLTGCVFIGLSAVTFIISRFMEDVDSTSKETATKMTARYYRSDKQQKFSVLEAIPESLEDIFKIEEKEPIQNLIGFSNAVVGLKVSILNSYTGQQVENTCLGQAFNRHIVLPYHAVCGAKDDWCILTAYKKPNLIHYDKLKCNIIYFDLKDDVAVVRLPDGQPSYFPSRSIAKEPSNAKAYLLTPSTQSYLDNTTLTKLDCAIEYKKYGFPEGLGVIPPGESVAHSFGMVGLCGAPVYSGDGFLYGHHVAFLVDKEYGDSNRGVCKIFRRSVRDKIRQLASAPDEFFVKLKDETKMEGSLAPMDEKFFCPPMSKSKFTPSAVNGIFPEMRVPARLEGGNEYLKTVMKESIAPAETPDIEAATFAKKCMRRLVAGSKFRRLTDAEIVEGTEFLGPIDKTTSCGFGFSSDKSDYIDFEKKTLKPSFAELVKDTEKRIMAGEYVLKDREGKPCMFFQEQLKDELRDLGKEVSPRVFKMSSVLHTWLTRKYFGPLLEHLHARRLATGVAVGTNPFSDEWDDIYKRLCRFPTGFDGDYRKFDKRMVRLIQDLWNECVMEEYAVPQLSNMFTFLLNTICNTPTITGDLVYFTTHSMPSGVGVTAEFNSAINEGYISYCYFVLARKHRGIPTSDDFFNEVVSVKYGDDLVASVHPSISGWFNGETYQQVMRKLGLDFTPADKGEWNEGNRLKPISECTFLKRGFSFHTKLGRIVAPLDKKTMQATLNFVKDARLNDELTRTKLLNFQREAYLHPDYENMMEYVDFYCNRQGNFPILFSTDQDLKEAYEGGNFNPYAEFT